MVIRQRLRTRTSQCLLPLPARRPSNRRTRTCSLHRRHLSPHLMKALEQACHQYCSLRASSFIWASETSLARTREQAAKKRLTQARLASLAQIGELARRLPLLGRAPSPVTTDLRSEQDSREAKQPRHKSG